MRQLITLTVAMYKDGTYVISYLAFCCLRCVFDTVELLARGMETMVGVLGNVIKGFDETVSH